MRAATDGSDERTMERRRFLQSMAAGAAALSSFSATGEAIDAALRPGTAFRGTQKASDVAVEGHTLLCTFNRASITWKVYEDFRVQDGALTFVASTGSARV